MKSPVFSKLELSLYLGVTRLGSGLMKRHCRTMAQAQGISDVKCNERLGKASQTRRDGYLIWFHARDIQHARPFLDVIEELVEIYPDLQFLITTRKHEHIADFEAQLPDYICHQFLPLELMKPIREFLAYWTPDIAVFSGGELLPRMMREIDKEDIPLVSVNTQITERMFHRLKWLPGLASAMVKSFDMILVENKIQNNSFNWNGFIAWVFLLSKPNSALNEKE